MGSCPGLCNVLGRMGRRKAIAVNKDPTKGLLARVLNTVDLVGLGIASTMGSGVYVIVGQVAHDVAGPSIVLSFLIAGVACVFAGLCYAEFGARVPKAGSAYVYSYVTVGELWAFSIGWNLVLEYIIGTASIARATSSYIDFLSHYAISNFSRHHMPINISTFSDYPDLLAFFLTFIFAVALCFGVRESSFLNNMFTVVNVGMTSYIIVCGAFKADLHNWNLPKSEVHSNNTLDNGGFFPFGVSGMLQGAATCFYAFVGFDVIATTGEEVMNPHKAIPYSIIASLTICGSMYIGVAAVITLMVPYWTLEGEAQIPPAFDRVGYNFATYFITVGALTSLFTCLYTTIIPMPRIFFAMARDGLLFKWLATVSKRFKTPYVSTLLSATIAGLMAMLFELADLVKMMSIGTLLAYALVAACVLILRFEPGPEGTEVEGEGYNEIEGHERSAGAVEEDQGLISTKKCSTATPTTSRNVKIAVAMLVIEAVFFDLVGTQAFDKLAEGSWWAILLLAIPSVAVAATLVFIALQPRGPSLDTFQVPLVPLVPAISIVLNIYLMLKLSSITWIRFGVWLLIGFGIYFTYGIRHSNPDEAYKDEDLDEKETHQPVNAVINERSPLLHAV